MKKTVLIIFMFLCSTFLSAQEVKDYQFFVNYIDSLKKEYSIKSFVNGINCELPNVYRKYFSNLSREEQYKVLNYVCNLYNQDNYIGLYGLAGVFLDEYYYYAKDSVKSRMIEINFDKICYMSSTVINFGNSKYYTQHAKDRLLEIAEKRWTEEDIKAWTVFIKQTLNIDSYKRDVQKIMKETGQEGKQTENYLLDSLIQNGIKKNLQANINRPIYERCIMMIGSLNDPRFIPSLERMLEEYKDRKDYPEIKKACTYALAKLGVKKYLDEVYNSGDYIYYEYLGTKEAFLKYLDKKFVWNKGSIMFTNQPLLPSALIALQNSVTFGYGYLEKIPEEIEQDLWFIMTHYVIPENFEDYDPGKDGQNKESIQKAYKIYNWIKENQDVWELPPAKDSF